MNDIAVIHLKGKRGGFAIVDADMFEFLNQFNWSLGWGDYPIGHIPGFSKQPVRLHVIVNGTPLGKKTDHRNRWKIDNTRRNLRTCNDGQNGQNQSVQTREKHSRFKGVCFNKRRNKWLAYIGSKATRIYLGCTFGSDRDAAAAYNKAALAQYGEYAALNEL